MELRLFCRLSAAAVFAFSALSASAQQSSYHKYWDGNISPPIRWSKGCKVDPEQFAVDNPLYARPQLMAMGDSLYNGVQSLRMNWWLSEWSAPSLVAIRLGLIREYGADRTGEREFYSPQYPKQGSSPSETINYGLNLEEAGIKYRAINLTQVPRRQQISLRELLSYTPPNGRAMVDNIAFSGANSLDILHWTPGDFRNLAENNLDKMGGRLFGIPKAFKALGSAFTYSNAAFVLNPTRDDCLEKLTALQQVELREPKRLLLNIGSNNGVYLAGFSGQAIESERGFFGKQVIADNCNGDEELIGINNKPRCIKPIKKFIDEQLTSDIEHLLKRLSKVKNLEYVYINNLALPSQTANVIFPKWQARGSQSFSLDILNNKQIDRNTINNADNIVRKVNKKIKEAIENQNKLPGPRFVYVDMARTLEAYDYKRCIFSKQGNCQNRTMPVLKKLSGTDRDYVFDNRPMKAAGTSGLRTGSDFAAGIKQGGLFSFDNMHLSSLGYEVMALAVRYAMQAEGDPALVPLPKSGSLEDRCVRKSDVRAMNMKQGDCKGLLTYPGWSMTDATRREFIFHRMAGDSEMRNRDFISAMLAFVN